MRIFGLMLIEIESFKDSKQDSGYGVVLQKDLRFVVACNVVVEEEEEESESESDGKRRMKKNNSLRDTEEAMEGRSTGIIVFVSFLVALK